MLYRTRTTVLLTALSLSSFAAGPALPSAYLIDSAGLPVRSAEGLCWRSGYWSNKEATGICDPDTFIDNHVVPPHATVEGNSISEWSMEFWKWLASIPSEQSPARDKPGASCSLNQSGPVWYLAGRLSSGSSTRTCSVPYGKYILFPMVTAMSYRRMDDATNCQLSIRRAREVAATSYDLGAAIDNVQIRDPGNHLENTQTCVDMNNRIIASGPPMLYSAAVSGYWVMVAPLPRGKHVLEFGGGTRADNFLAKTRYEIEVD